MQIRASDNKMQNSQVVYFYLCFNLFSFVHKMHYNKTFYVCGSPSIIYEDQSGM